MPERVHARVACSGDALFQTHENLEHLAMMEAVLGKIPEHMAVAANSAARKYFVTRCALSAFGNAVKPHRSLLPCSDGHPHRLQDFRVVRAHLDGRAGASMFPIAAYCAARHCVACGNQKELSTPGSCVVLHACVMQGAVGQEGLRNHRASMCASCKGQEERIKRLTDGMRRRDRTELNWPGGAASRRSVRAVAKLSPLKALMATLGDKSLRPHLDALLDLLLQAARLSAVPHVLALTWRWGSMRRDIRVRALATQTLGSSGVVRRGAGFRIRMMLRTRLVVVAICSSLKAGQQALHSAHRKAMHA